MERVEATELVGDLASQQWGLVTAAQAADLGIDSPTLRRLEKAGVVHRLRHGVYALAGTALTPEVELKGEWLALRPDLMAGDRVHDSVLAKEAVVSHTTAANLWGIGDLWPDGFHFTVCQRRRSRQSGVRFHRANLTEGEWEMHPSSGLPVTTVARTVADLADDGHEPQHLLDLVSDAARLGIVEKDELVSALEGKEVAFGLNFGEFAELYDLISKVFPMSEQEVKAREMIEQSLEPLRVSLNEIAITVRDETAISEKARKSIDQLVSKLNTSLPGGVSS